MLTQINDLRTLARALGQTYHMVKNTLKLFAACVVMGIVNQACALVPAERASPYLGQDRFPQQGVSGGQSQPKAVTARSANARILVAQATPETRSDTATGTNSKAAPDATSAPKPEDNPAPGQTTPPGAASTPDVGDATTDTPSTLTISPANDSESISQETSVPASPAVAPAEESNVNATVPVPLPDQPVYSDSPQAEPRYENLWDRIRAGFAMDDVESPRVEAHLAAYLNGPEYFQRMIARSRRYLHYIVEEVEKREMPLEIALLPMVESAFNPVAYSRAHASGIWQFIPATGKRYGLKQTFWYDGRRDVTAATKAALDYLQRLHDEFGDWQLALAAYNSGEGTVRRAVRANRSLGRETTYVHLNLPRETRNYLPKLQAIENIIADPERFGFALEDIPNQPYFTKVKATRTMDMRRAAQLADMPLEEFRSLNAGHNRPVISSHDGHSILVPVDRAEMFATNVQTASSTTTAQPLVTWQTYTMKARENLNQVAARFGIDVETLKRVNGIGVKKRPRPGHALLVPMINPSTDHNLDAHYDTLQTQPPPVDEPPAMVAYRVRPGETLKSIADRHNVSVSQIMKWNKLKVARVSVGQQLKLIPGPAKISKARAHGRSKVAVKNHKPAVAHAKTAKRKQSIARR